MKQPSGKYVRILSIDGGGIRSIIPGQILCVLEEKLKAKTGRSETRLVDYFDLIAGSGSGGIMACAYLSPIKPQNQTARFSAVQVADIFLRYGKKIYEETFDHKLLSVGGLIDEKYSSYGMEKLLKEYFDDLQLSHLLKPCLVPAYDITRRQAHFFTQHTALRPSEDFLVRDIARATTASPTYFECKRVQSLSGVSYPMIDGGVFANNPALCAYAEARKIYAHPGKPDKGVTANGMVVLSLGTGKSKLHYEFDEAKNWGVASWSRPLIDIMASSSSEVVDYQLSEIFSAVDVPSQYLRIDTKLGIDVDPAMDKASVDNMQALKELGQYVAEEVDDQLTALVDLLTA
ncbi:MAG: patatin-like phospholipase family protein [Cytophagales bacterium]|jgi:patatin-like phospholipase/acyl hydrolase|nr:patatin-like phospholipase family protein [Cytophagales bacterium]